MRRRIALLVSCALVLITATVLTVPAASADPTPTIAIATSGPETILAGEAAEFSLTATNLSAQPEYNLTLRTVLPVGVNYHPGSTGPTGTEEPTVSTDPVTGQQTLLWIDTFDLQVGSTSAITFTVDVGPTAQPVGSSFDLQSNGYASTKPRVVPKFNPDGTPVAGQANIQTSDSNTATTTVTAISITKAEPSVESKLLRGVHDQSTVYTLTVTNNALNATEAITVTDYLPANLEFLGCAGQLDNSTAEEYPGSGPITVPAPTSDCPTPQSVSTVQDPAGYPAGSYTKVSWSIGDLVPGADYTITYAAAVPLRENAAFPDPVPGGLDQIANLDNNTGPSTRQDGAAASAVNHVHASGSYQGTTVDGPGPATVTADASHTVTVNDLRIHKSIDEETFSSGAIATFTLHIDSGEYTDNGAITVTDVLPNGLCPLDNVANHVTGSPSDCAPATGQAPTVAFQSVTQNPDGTFTVVFAPIASVPANDSTTITYQARMRTTYTGGTLAGQATVAGDSFTNTANEAGTSTPVSGSPESGSKSVTDPTSATQRTDQATLSKQVGERTTPMTCSSAAYVHSETPIPDSLAFVKGDRVCFKLTVPFADDTQTRNPVLTDFLPDNLQYETGSWTVASGNSVPTDQIEFQAGTGENTGLLTWTLGALTNGIRDVPKNSTLIIEFSAIVTGAAQGPAPAKAGNIVKLRTENSNGAAQSLRDGINFAIAPAPIDIRKGVQSVNGVTNPGGGDHVEVVEGDAVVFHLDIKNLSGTTTTGPAIATSDPDVWDVLPLAITCAAVTLISDNGACYGPNSLSFDGGDLRSAIRWNNTGVTIPGGGAHSLTYTLTVPAGSSVATTLVNTASVRSYSARTDLNSTSTQLYYPGNNVDTSIAAELQDPTPVTDPSDIYLPAASVTKGVTSAVNEAGNRGGEAAPATSTDGAIGEQVTFTVIAKIPAHTSVYNATLSDPLPTGLTLDSRMAQFSPNAGGSYQALPTGVSLTSGQNQITFGEFYDNTTDNDQWFKLTVYSRVAMGATGTLINTGTFDSGSGIDPNQDPAAQSASANVVVVNPTPKLTKTNNSGGPVAGGSIVTFTLTASNTTGSVLHNAWVVDCLPAGLIFSAYGSPTRGWTDPAAPGAGPGSNNVSCPIGTTQLAWNVGDLAAGVSGSLSYTATVDPTATGSLTYTNNAYLTGDSLAGPRSVPSQAQPTGAQRYPTSALSTVTVAGASLVKSVTPAKPTVGDTLTYTLTATIPANVNFYNVALIDTLPAGVDASTVALVADSVTCVNDDTSGCGLTSATPLTRSGQVVGWLFGDANSASQKRTVTLQYTAKVANITDVARDAVLTNSAHISWNAGTGTAPTSADATFHSKSTDDTASVVIREPSLSITKAASNTTPQPGDVFTYSLSVSNASGTTMSDAYNITVSDVVPTGIVVGSISDGGTIAGNDPSTGGGTITWTLAGPLAPGASVNGGTGLLYSATLSPSGTLGVAALVNTATVTGYDSLSSGGRHYTGPSTSLPVTPKFPHLTTTKTTPGGTTAYLGESFGWSVTILNATGAGKAYAVGATDTLPPNWTYDVNSAMVSVNGAAATHLEPAIATAGQTQTLTWPQSPLSPLAAVLLAGQHVVITYTATPGTGAATAPGVGLVVNHTNTATPTGEDATGATGNKTGSYSGSPATAVAHIGSADVTITKAVGTAPVAGANGTWTLTVANAGPDAAVGPFTVTDSSTPPTGIAITGAAGTGWTCTLGPISCHRTNPANTLAAAASFPAITVSYSVAANVATGTGYNNTATVTARTHDPNPANNTSTVTTTVSTVADLGISKVLSGAMVAGQNATYTISVHNYGPSDSQGPITVTDPLPAGTTFVSAAGGASWSCDEAPTRLLTCTRGTVLTNGADAQDIVVVIAIPAGQTTAVTNVATVIPTTGQGANTHADTATVVTTPGTSADLSVVKTLTTTALVAGATATYHLAVHNNGPSDAKNVVITDTLPSTLTYKSYVGTGWSCDAPAQLVTCTYTANAGVLANNASSALDLTVTVGQLRGAVSNTATIAADTPDPASANNTSTADSSITRSADLSILKSHTGTAVAGQSLAYTLQVHNAGPSNASGDVTVTDTLPAGLTYQSATGTDWACGYEDETRTVTCVGAADLATGTNAAPITVTVDINPDAGPATLVNTATVAGTDDSPDPTPANNTATDSTVVTVLTDLTLVKTLTTATPVVAGMDATFTLQATNAGPSDAATISVTDTLPTYLSYVSATGSGWNCGNTGQVVTCTRPTLPATAPANVATITIVATVDPSTPFVPVGSTTTLRNIAAITTGSPGTTHNPGPVDVPVIAKADLRLIKSVNSETTVAGTDVSWTLAVHNAGPSDAAGPITVTDILPGFQSAVSVAGIDWTCTPGTAPSPPSADAHQTLVCTLDGPLAAGEDAPDITVLAHVDAGAPVGDQTNLAIVVSPTLDPMLPDNTGTATTTVSRVAELSIVKSHTGNGKVGEELSFELAVHNAGPSQADQVFVTDALPAGLTYVSGAGTGWTCEAAGAEVTCTLDGTLDPNADAPLITLVTTVDATAYPSVVNTAIVGSTSPDLPDTDDSVDPVTIDPLAQLAITKTHQGAFTVGTHGTYEIVVTNTGPTPTPGPVLVADTLPAGLSFVSASGAGWVCSTAISCTWAEPMAVDQTATITVVVDVLASAYPQVVNTATATAPGSTPVTSTDIAPVTPVVDLSIVKQLTSYQDDVVTYSLTVHNGGPSATVSTVTVVDALPVGLRYLAAGGNGWTCAAVSNTVQCTHAGSIQAGASSVLTLRAGVSAAAGTEIHNIASVTGGGVDPSVTSTSNVVSFTVTSSGDLASTGAAVSNWLRLALLLILGGAFVLVLTRRRAS